MCVGGMRGGGGGMRGGGGWHRAERGCRWKEIQIQVRTFTQIAVLCRNRVKGSKSEYVQCEHVLHNTM